MRFLRGHALAVLALLAALCALTAAALQQRTIHDLNAQLTDCQSLCLRFALSKCGWIQPAGC